MKIRQRLSYLDVLRSAAMYLVIVLHIITPVFNSTACYGSRAWWLAAVLNGFVRMGVPTYFMISGYLALSGDGCRDIRAYYLQKLRRVVLPFLAWDVIYFLSNCYLDHTAVSLGRFFSELLDQGSEYHLWFVYEIMAFYLLTPFLKKLTAACSRRELWLLQGLLMLPTTFVPLVNTLFSTQILLWKPLFEGYLGYYLLGYILGTGRFTGKQTGLWALAGAAGWLLGFFGNLRFCSPESIELVFNYGYYLNHYLMAGGLFVTVRWFMARPGTVQRLLARICGRLSRVSFGVYLIHILILEHFSYRVAQLGLDLTALETMALDTLVVCLGATGICLLLERIPGLKRLV